jgi:hypothetical protein
MFVLERLLDDLGREAKEAPGWISLWTLCNIALYFVSELPVLGPLEKDRVTAATCASIVLFFIGDMVDILCFPRGRDPERAQKLVRNTMMISATLGFFLLFSKVWVLGVVVWLPWLLLWPLHNTLTRAMTGSGCDEPGDASNTGCSWLTPKSLKAAQQKARDALSLQTGVYAVSKALAKRAGDYWGKPWLANETSKLIRSTVVPVALVALFLFSSRLPLSGLVTTATVVGLLFAYARLKAWHMRRLYELASNTRPVPTCIEYVGLSVMTWDGLAVAYCVEGKWQEVLTGATPTPYPGTESLEN